MIRLLRFAAFGLAALGLSGPAVAAPLDYSGLYAFGDSLTDNGNAYALSFGRAPESPPYWRGRFTNGRNWYDRVAREIRDGGGETRNYAIGGAWAATNLDPIPDLRAQRRVFKDRADPEPGAIGAVFGGGNDLLARIGRARVKQTAREAADAVIDTAASLHRNGVDTTLVFNLPDLANIPRFADAKPSRRANATFATTRFNDRLARGVADLQADGRDVIAVDTFGLFAAVVADPAAYRIDNLTEPCLDGDRNRCTRREARRSAFFDSIHPSARMHAILGAHVLDLLAAPPPSARSASAIAAAALATAAAAAVPAPVPLPAPALLLLTGLAGLGLAARRGRPRLAFRAAAS